MTTKRESATNSDLITSLEKQLDNIYSIEFEKLYNEIINWYEKYDKLNKKANDIHNILFFKFKTEYDHDRVETPKFKEVFERNLIN